MTESSYTDRIFIAITKRKNLICIDLSSLLPSFYKRPPPFIWSEHEQRIATVDQPDIRVLVNA